MRRTAVALALLIVPVLALSGCAPTPPPATEDPKPSSTPLFANEEEALKAATEAYAAYVKVSDQILAEGGANPERIMSVATGDVAKEEREGYGQLSALGYHLVGATSFDGVTLQRFETVSAFGPDIVSVYLCTDVKGVDVLDSSGLSVVPPGRPDRTGFEVHFDAAKSSGQLLVSQKTVWEKDGVCS